MRENTIEEHFTAANDEKSQLGVALVISATFTAEPVADYIQWWFEQFGLSCSIHFAPYNQVFQALLDPASELSANHDINLLLIRIEDWVRDDLRVDGAGLDFLEKKLVELGNILKYQEKKGKYFVGVFPVSPFWAPNLKRRLEKLNQTWTEILAKVEDVAIIDLAQLGDLYGIADIYDNISDRIGHMPYSDEFYAALGTYVSRKICSYKLRKFKVIVLDCDNTLWKGICGEDGAQGVVIDDEHLMLQNFLLKQYDAGMLLTLCSKNDERDVLEVFEKNPHMRLRLEHLVGWKINWRLKSENIKAIAQELNLGLDSFIFLDDNPVECRDVMTRCPQVLTVKLPEDPKEIPGFLSHLWAFDRFAVSREDKQRTKMYRDERERQELQRGMPTLADFIKGLDLKMSMRFADELEIGRAAQLMQRTNQFTLSAIRRTEASLRTLLRDKTVNCWAVDVVDRFGDYGLTGVVITRRMGEKLFLDTFLLSCRVLGRSIEDAVLSCLKKHCRERGIDLLEAEFHPTARNGLFQSFLERTQWRLANDYGDRIKYVLRVEDMPDSVPGITCHYNSVIAGNSAGDEPKIENPVLFDHIAVAVSDLESAVKYYFTMGYTCKPSVYDPLQHVYLSICRKEGYLPLELVAPASEDSPVARLLQKVGNAPYHLCYRVKHATQFLTGLEKAKIEFDVIGQPKPAVLFDYKTVVFISIAGLGLIELLEDSGMGDLAAGDTGGEVKNIIRLVATDSDRPVRFCNYLGYVRERIRSDQKRNISLITMRKPGAGEIEMVIPFGKGDAAEEYSSADTYIFQLCHEVSDQAELIKHLEQTGMGYRAVAPKYGFGGLREAAFCVQTHEMGFNLYYEKTSGERAVKPGNWQVYMENREQLLHRCYLLPLQYHTGSQLVNLPFGLMATGAESDFEPVCGVEDVEKGILKIWRDLLHNQTIGVDDDFFHAGGNSLKAAGMAARVYKQYHIELPLGEIFGNPTVSGLTAYLKNRRRNIRMGIPPAEKSEYYPVSQAQSRLFIFGSYDRSSIVYNMPRAIMIEGEVDREKFEWAFRELMARHETLRTSFSMQGEGIVQKVHDQAVIPINFPEARGTEIPDLINDFIRPFDLGAAPLFRVSLTRVAPQKFLMLFDIHHIICDGISMGILFNEFKELYQGRKLTELSLQYKDIAVWQKQQEQTAKIKCQQQYWLDLYRGEIPKLDLPCDYTRPALQSFEGSRKVFELGEELTAQLAALALETGTTLFMILLSAYTILLSKYASQEDIIVGCPVAGRNHGEMENGVGMFVNVLPLRNQPAGAKTFIQFLGEVRGNSLKALENQDFSYDRLVELLKLKRDLSRNPLFDTVFVFQNMEEKNLVTFNVDVGESVAGNLRFRQVDFELNASKYDLTLEAVEDRRRIKFSLEYCTKLFCERTIEQLISHYIRILHQIVQNGEIKLSEISLLTDADVKWIDGLFNHSAAAIPNQTINQMFEEASRAYPENTAIIAADQRITYRDLNIRANRLAWYLLKRGVSPDSLIGVLLDNSIETGVAIIAILKSGAAYLPLDPEYPDARINHILKDSGAQIILTQKKYLSREVDFEGEMIDIEENRFLTREEQNPEGVNHPQNLAYVIYTSGSTGDPKGVMIDHCNLVNYVGWRIREYRFKPDDVTLQLLSVAFDGFGSNFYSSLLSGGTLVMPANKLRRDFDQIGNLIKINKVTNMSVVPPMYRAILDSASPDQLSTLRFVVLAGDKANSDLVNLSRSKSIHTVLINEYGPTENTIAATAYWGLTAATVAVIGRPIANNRLYILGKESEIPLPVGVPGELCIAGAGLGRGYLNHPEMTRRKFRPNAWVKADKLYRTGDLARMRWDGNIEFLGRVDHQVKVRGYRVELGEIESVLATHPGVKAAFVTANEDRNHAVCLCAYVGSDSGLNSKELRRYLTERLPEYMIPQYFLKLAEIPLTPNGKIDKSALPALSGSMETGVEYIAPRDDLERKLARIGSEILEVKRIGMDDNFFDLGGHSLKAANLITGIMKEFKVKIPLMQIFETPRFGAIAQRIKQAERAVCFAIEPAPEGAYYPVSAAQKRLFILDKLEDLGTSYNMPLLMKIEGDVERQRIAGAFRDLIKRHEILRTSFAMVNGEPVQLIHEPADFNLEYAEMDESDLTDRFRSFIQPFRLDRIPLFRVCLAKLGEHHYALMLDMHHIISDGISIGILTQEFSDLYNGKAIPPLKLQYKDYAAWQRNFLQSGYVRRQQEFWLNRYQDGVQVLNIPTDYPRPPVADYEGAMESFAADGLLTDHLKKLALSTRTSLYMILLAAFDILLSRYSGQEDIVVGSPLAGRRQPESETLIGIFINTVAIRNHPHPELKFKEFLDGLKTNYLNSYENQDYQFEELIEQLDIPRDLGRKPLFDVMFALQNIKPIRIDIQGLRFTLCDFDTHIAKYDLTLNAVERTGGIKFGFQYRAKLFKAETIRKMAAHFLNILTAIVQNPDLKLYQIDLLSEAEKNRILYSWNNTATSYPKSKTWRRLFEEQVEKTPDQIALVFGDLQFSYAELNRKANQLAHTLSALGVRSESTVAIITEPSHHMIIAILGVIKAGGAYLPIDPGQPRERVAFILKDSRSELVLCQERYRPDCANPAIRHLILDDDLYRGETENLPEAGAPSDLRYIIYTSGTTGKPKGTLIEDHSLVNYVCWFSGKAGLTPADKGVLVSSYAFDLGYTTLYSALAGGCELHILPKDIYTVPRELLGYIVHNQITYLKTTPSLFNLIVRSAGFSYVKDLPLRLIVLGGEPVNPADIECFHSQHPHVQIMNHYGPTETTIGSIAHLIDFDQYQWFKANPVIGKPISNTRVYILDSRLRPVPQGVVGDIHIAGAGVARGYLNCPELTAAKFTRDPFRAPGKERMYRTGDQGRHLQDGSIEFWGRVDDQIKIRGYRVEPSEIEARLKQNGLINEAVVLGKANESGEKFLCAYLVGKETLKIEDLREYLGRELPDYMIPSFFIQVDRIPLTPNGKIDRNALLRLEFAAASGPEYAAPGSGTEETIVKIWQEVTGINKIGVHDGFFTIGGNSLLLIRVHERLEQAFPGRLKVTDLFTYTTVSKIAALMDNASSDCLRNPPQLEMLALPPDCCPENPENQGRYGGNRFGFCVKETLFDRLKAAGGRSKVELSNILLAAYVYILSVKARQKRLAVQAMLDEAGKMTQIKVDLNRAGDFIDLCRWVERERNGSRHGDYKVEELPKSSLHKGNNLVLPAICLKRHLSGERSRLDVYDIILEIDLGETALSFNCDYNSRRIKEETIAELIDLYLKMLEYLAEESETANRHNPVNGEQCHQVKL
jgi:amino acid adenylation domain-containing protein/FkbH-like protein